MAEGYTEDVTERGELTALQMKTVEIRHEIQEHCRESRRLRELTRSLRRDLVLARAKTGETRVKVLHRMLRERVSGATAGWEEKAKG